MDSLTVGFQRIGRTVFGFGSGFRDPVGFSLDKDAFFGLGSGFSGCRIFLQVQGLGILVFLRVRIQG
jgi:hypothetical protein